MSSNLAVHYCMVVRIRCQMMSPGLVDQEYIVSVFSLLRVWAILGKRQLPVFLVFPFVFLPFGLNLVGFTPPKLSETDCDPL